jgi:AcrR family transcriptional regulator
VKTEKPEIVTDYSGKQVQILEVAERLFAEHGFEGTSVRDIAQEAGVNVAMISYYFGSKEKLLQAIFNYRSTAGRLFLEHIVADKSMHPLDKIDALADGMVDRMMQHKTFHRVMQQSQMIANNEEVAQMIKQMKQKNFELVNKIVAEGQQKKVFVKGIDTGMLMMTVIGTIYQATTGSVYFKNPHDPSKGEEYSEFMKKKLKAHLKHVLKAVLTYEGK